MLLEKYAPKSTKEIAGNASAIMELKKALARWEKGRALLVHGPTGSGKSTAIKLAAQEMGYELVEIHANEKRAASDFLQVSQQRGLFYKKKILLFEDLETMTLRGFSELISRSGHPVICTVGDFYQLSPAFRKLFRPVKFEKISAAEMLKFLGSVCKKEGLLCEQRQLEQLSKTSNGDVRSALIDLEILKLSTSHIAASSSAYPGYRDAEDSIFTALRIIFKTTSLENSRIALENYKDDEELFRWLQENIAEEYTDIQTIALAYDYLSKADIFRSRIIKRQSWSLQKYTNLAAYGISLAKAKPSARIVSYRFPGFARKSETLLEKIGGNFHVSKKRASVYIPILKMLGRKNPGLLEELGLDEKEISALMDSSKESHLTY